jgi:putative hydrolase of the HAD superfamily
MMDRLPKAVLLDLDDTILNHSGHVARCWRDSCYSGVADLGGPDPDTLLREIHKTREWFWSGPDRHRTGRQDLYSARREIVTLALAAVGQEHPALASRIAGAYSRDHEAGIEPLPGAVETVRWLREAGCRLALVTNGSSAMQRRKIGRFALQDCFDAILIEGEMGFGKPDERVYRLALETLSVSPADAWMAGDNLEWDVRAPQRLGIRGIWVHPLGGVGSNHDAAAPDRVVRALSELRSPEPAE